MRHYVYIIQSEVDATFYTGSTSSLRRRLEEHNNGLSRYTSRKKPWRLIYFEDFDNKSEALKRELFFKAMKNRVFYQRLIDSLI